MQITFLGTGTSGGVPILTCDCQVCRSLDFRDKRLRVSVHIEIEGKSFVIDTGPDFRQQALRERISKVDAVIFTHEHRDHTAGLDDIRPYNYLHGIRPLNIYAHARVLEQLQLDYAYIFVGNKYPGLPLVNLQEVDNQAFMIENVQFQPIQVMHFKLPVLGFRINDFTYITDANFIADEELEKIKGTKILVLNALQKEPHISHFTLQEAIEVAQKIGAEKTYFTHISHKLGLHDEVEKALPENVYLAYDGLRLNICVYPCGSPLRFHYVSM
jgi:phosphoribosyl 1,2-cyclic phosphate phosphodiesterase